MNDKRNLSKEQRASLARMKAFVEEHKSAIAEGARDLFRIMVRIGMRSDRTITRTRAIALEGLASIA